LPGLKAFEFWLDFKLFGEVKTVGMDVNGIKRSGILRGSEDYNK